MRGKLRLVSAPARIVTGSVAVTRRMSKNGWTVQPGLQRKPADPSCGSANTPGVELAPSGEDQTGSLTGAGCVRNPGAVADPAAASSTAIAPRNALIIRPHRGIRSANNEKSLDRRPAPGKLVSMPFVDNILQPTHLLLILVVALLVLGPKRLPEAGRALGKGIRDFRSAMSGDEHQPRDEIVGQASSVEATQPKEPATPPAEPFQPVG